MAKYYIIFILFLFPAKAYLQVDTMANQIRDTVINDLDLPYAQRVQMSYLNGKYIPADLDDCLNYLLKISDPEGIERFKQAEENTVASKLHFGLGKWMMANWNLVEGSRYSEFLRKIGISHPDDMVQFTIVSLHRSLNNKPLEVEQRVEEYREKRLQELLEWQENARKNGKVDTLNKL